MSWICKPTAGHETHGQSVVYDEETGKSIAIVYDGDTHGQVIAKVPELLEALQEMVEYSLCRQANTAERKMLSEHYRALGRKYIPLLDSLNAACSPSGHCV